ncbi:23197_t:CDS:2, partial [Entrophospora sp. SA101]
MSPHEEESINELEKNASNNNDNVEYNITNPTNNDNNSIITSKTKFKKLV